VYNGIKWIVYPNEHYNSIWHHLLYTQVDMTFSFMEHKGWIFVLGLSRVTNDSFVAMFNLWMERSYVSDLCNKAFNPIHKNHPEWFVQHIIQIFSLCVHWKKVSHDTRMSKWWQNVHYWLNCSFNEQCWCVKYASQLCLLALHWQLRPEMDLYVLRGTSW